MSLPRRVGGTFRDKEGDRTTDTGRRLVGGRISGPTVTKGSYGAEGVVESQRRGVVGGGDDVLPT